MIKRIVVCVMALGWLWSISGCNKSPSSLETQRREVASSSIERYCARTAGTFLDTAVPSGQMLVARRYLDYPDSILNLPPLVILAERTPTLDGGKLLSWCYLDPRGFPSNLWILCKHKDTGEIIQVCYELGLDEPMGQMDVCRSEAIKAATWLELQELSEQSEDGVISWNSEEGEIPLWLDEDVFMSVAVEGDTGLLSSFVPVGTTSVGEKIKAAQTGAP